MRILEGKSDVIYIYIYVFGSKSCHLISVFMFPFSLNISHKSGPPNMKHQIGDESSVTLFHKAAANPPKFPLNSIVTNVVAPFVQDGAPVR